MFMHTDVLVYVIFLSPKRHMKGVWWQKTLSEELVDYLMTLYICMVMK